MKTIKRALSLVLCGLAATAVAKDGDAGPARRQCEANYSQEGGFIAGRTFSSWGEVAVPMGTAYKRIYMEMMKAGLKISSSDKELGMLTGEQHVTVQGRPTALPVNVVIEEAGAGAKVTVTKTTPSGYATSKGYQIEYLCQLIETAAG